MKGWILLAITVLSSITTNFSFDIRILDNCMPNTNVLDLNAFINPHGGQANMMFTLSKIYKASEYFEIRDAKLFTKLTINIDQMCSTIDECCNKELDYCDLKISIVYSDNLNSLTTKRDLSIHITDVNDHVPQFDDSSFELRLSESKRDPHFVILPLANDADFGKNRIQDYRIDVKEPSSFDEYLSLVVNKDLSVPSQVGLKLNRNLDREMVSVFSCKLLAIDGGQPMKKTGSILVKIIVTDENDNSPIFQKKLYHEIVKEGVFSSLPIVILFSTDIDEGENAMILYNFAPRFLTDSVINDRFKIESNGRIFLRKALDYEKQKFYKFSVTATNPTPFSNNTLAQSSAIVEIEVENVDDEPLQIIVDYAGGRNWSQISENKPDIFIAFITARSMESSRETFGIVCNLQGYEKTFKVVPKLGDDTKTKSFEVRTILGIDREEHPRIETIIICKESNSVNSKYSEASLVVVILDENDNAPQLRVVGETSVMENEVIGKVIFTVKAHDPDEGENGRVSFSMDKSNSISIDYLTIGERDGKVRVKNTIDCEANHGTLTSFEIIVTGTDHGRPPKSTDTTLHINVNDVNDNIPSFLNRPLQFSIVENSMEFTTIGEIEVQDKDHSDKVTLKLINNNQMLIPFVITTKDNKIFFLNSTKSIDREKDAMFKFQIVASDGSRESDHSVTETVEVKVIDVNDNAPIIIFPTQNNASIHRISYLEPINHRFILVSATDHDQLPDNNRLEYIIDDELKIFGISNEETFITTQREMKKDDLGEHKIKIIVRDCGIPQLESSVTISIVIDQSTPNSIPSTNNARYNSVNGDKTLSSNSDVILYVTIVVILFVIIIISAIFVYFLRRCKKRDSCFYRAISSWCLCFGPKSTKSTENSNFNESNQNHNTHQLPLINNEHAFRVNTVNENWIPENSRVPSYNSEINPFMSPKSPYTKLISQPTSYYPLQYSHVYQTIEDGHLGQRHGDMSMMRIPSYQLRGKNGERYQSDLNLKKWYFMDNDPNEMFPPDDRATGYRFTSQTPLPNRSRNITNTLINGDLNNDNFAVAFPKDQSTFV